MIFRSVVSNPHFRAKTHDPFTPTSPPFPPARVRTLVLPGMPQARIGSLGAALFKMSRLRHLDLSCNALVSLEVRPPLPPRVCAPRQPRCQVHPCPSAQGLEHLRELQSLNLYYNHISSVAELHRLRRLASLRQIDLRLNPLAADGEPCLQPAPLLGWPLSNPDALASAAGAAPGRHYRLQVIYALPQLTKLDTLAVTAAERGKRPVTVVPSRPALLLALPLAAAR